MDKAITLKLYEIVGSPYCVATDDGQIVHDQLAQALQKNVKVRLSFLNVERLTSAFLNVAIGQLYGEFSEEQISSYLTATDIEPDDLALLRRVIDTAKAYFKNPEIIDKIRNDVLGDDDDAQ